MIPEDLKSSRENVNLFQITFPRLTKYEAIAFINTRILQKKGVAICFPDMSTLNIAVENPNIQKLIEEHFVPFNDGAGLELASILQKRRFLANLNGTDLIPTLLKKLDPSTTVLLIGSTEQVINRTREKFQQLFPSLDFIGALSGFNINKSVLEEIFSTKAPDLVLVGMGNPLQLEFIYQQRCMPGREKATWLAVGGLFDYYGGTYTRAPKLLRALRMEWLSIVFHQPYKFIRYFWGIPKFLFRTLFRSLFENNQKRG